MCADSADAVQVKEKGHLNSERSFSTIYLWCRWFRWSNAAFAGSCQICVDVIPTKTMSHRRPGSWLGNRAEFRPRYSSGEPSGSQMGQLQRGGGQMGQLQRGGRRRSGGRQGDRHLPAAVCTLGLENCGLRGSTAVHFVRPLSVPRQGHLTGQRGAGGSRDGAQRRSWTRPLTLPLPCRFPAASLCSLTKFPGPETPGNR